MELVARKSSPHFMMVLWKEVDDMVVANRVVIWIVKTPHTWKPQVEKRDATIETTAVGKESKSAKGADMDPSVDQTHIIPILDGMAKIPLSIT